MATTKPTPIKSKPGIRRDGTVFDGDEYSDGLWTRFYRSRPKKIGGYRAVTSTLPEVIRGYNAYTADATNYYALGSASKLKQVETDLQGVFSDQNDRTPGALVADPNNLWQMDNFYNSAAGNVGILVAHAAPNMDDIASTVERAIFYGNSVDATSLTATGLDPNSGGVVSVFPYVFGYGNNGRVDIGAVGSVTGANQSAFVTGQKIVKGMRLRGGGGGPAALFWSLNALVRATFNSAILTGIPFSFDEVGGSSILSSQGVVEFDGVYFWMGIDRILMFNGVIREVPNDMNLNFFFDNINYTWRQKAYAFKVPHYGEIWFCAPLGNATECNHAIIYNIRENTWYDTVLPGTGRSVGFFADVFGKPFTTDLVQDLTTGNFTLWQMETGVDQVSNAGVQPIQSYFTTNELNMLDSGLDKTMRVDIVEPDLVQVGDMTVTITGRANARSINQQAVTKTFIEPPAVAAIDQVVTFKNAYRLVSFTFESNTVGGDYYMGKILGHIEPDGGRYTQ